MTTGLIAGIAITTLIFGVLMLWNPKGWRTLLFNVFNFAALITQEILDTLQDFPLADIFDSQTAAGMLLAMAVFGIILRRATTTPIGEDR